ASAELEPTSSCVLSTEECGQLVGRHAEKQGCHKGARIRFRILARRGCLMCHRPATIHAPTSSTALNFLLGVRIEHHHRAHKCATNTGAGIKRQLLELADETISVPDGHEGSPSTQNNCWNSVPSVFMSDDRFRT